MARSVIIILALFGSNLALVAIVAFMKPSGNTGIDIAKIQQWRVESDMALRQEKINNQRIEIADR